MRPVRVTVWNEFDDEKHWPEIMDMYAGGVHEYIARFLRDEEDMEVTAVTLDDPEYGLPDELLDRTDVLVWYSHMKQDVIPSGKLRKIADRVIEDGMGVIFVHSGFFSNVASFLIGAHGCSAYREIKETERVFVIDRGHPIAKGLPEFFEFPESEMYSEGMGTPTPDETVFLSWYAGGNAARSGMCWKRGAGRVFYFSPGHAWYDVMLHEPFHTVIKNAVRWAAPSDVPCRVMSGRIEAIPDRFADREEKHS